MIKSNVFETVNKGRIKLLKYKKLSDLFFVNHAISTRCGGVSVIKGLESLNLGTHTADSEDNVCENYRRFCNAAGFDIEKLVLGNQTHSTNVRVVTEDDWGKGVMRERDYTDVDALITNLVKTPLVIHTADCVPVGFIDKNGGAIGNAHCGWRGTYGELASKTLHAMENEFGVRPENIVCTIGPCICMECYEVSRELYDDFEIKFGKSEALCSKDGKYYIDLSLINRHILVKNGVLPENIILSDLCTCCNHDFLFSHRGQGPERGIFASVLELTSAI
ncbi:MAG: peptidoglycan editing factor PgeF [Clostridia bacterium]|nr:peptidoglycan editing factor PgeF [Clostridia bacterium]